VRRLVAALSEAGVPLEQLEAAGAVVRTTIDVKAQTVAAAVVGRLAAPKELGAALTAVDPGSGGVRAYLSLRSTGPAGSRGADDLAGGEPVELAPELSRPFAEAGLPVLAQPRTRPIEVTAAYATLAAGGVARRTHFITSVTAVDGAVLYRAVGVVDPAVDPAVAERITLRLKENAGCNGVACVPGAPRWAAGYTPQLAVGVFVDEAGGAVDTGLPRSIWQEFLAGLGG
jgi:membrane peptidoglycan carboxypeptidase